MQRAPPRPQPTALDCTRGSSWRTVLTKLRTLASCLVLLVPAAAQAQFINVLDKGAKGDGIQDDSRFIAAACASNPGQTLRFPYTGHPYRLANDVAQPMPPLPPCNFITD